MSDKKLPLVQARNEENERKRASLGMLPLAEAAKAFAGAIIRTSLEIALEKAAPEAAKRAAISGLGKKDDGDSIRPAEGHRLAEGVTHIPPRKIGLS